MYTGAGRIQTFGSDIASGRVWNQVQLFASCLAAGKLPLEVSTGDPSAPFCTDSGPAGFPLPRPDL